MDVAAGWTGTGVAVGGKKVEVGWRALHAVKNNINMEPSNMVLATLEMGTNSPF